MKLSNFTQNLLSTGLVQPREIAETWMRTTIGWIMLTTAVAGIAMNSHVLVNYLNWKMTSFSILCSSKTVSNLIIIGAYFVYNAPITILNNFDGVTFPNVLVNQMVSYGVYLLGPVTQFAVSINRLLVMVFVKQAVIQNNQKITLVVLSIFWLISLSITAITTLDSCSVVYIPELLNWFSGGCDDQIGNLVMAFVVLIAILSNLCNLVVVVKLATSTNKGFLDSESARRRKRRSKKLFVQNCIQDWIFAIDSINSTFIDLLNDGILFRFALDIYSNLMTPVLDGLIMLFFNYEKKPRLKVLAVKKGTTTGSQAGGSASRF